MRSPVTVITQWRIRVAWRNGCCRRAVRFSAGWSWRGGSQTRTAEIYFTTYRTLYWLHIGVI